MKINELIGTSLQVRKLCSIYKILLVLNLVLIYTNVLQGFSGRQIKVTIGHVLINIKYHEYAWQ